MDDPTTTDAAAHPVSTFDLKAWMIRRGKAFSFVANHCSAAQAECLAVSAKTVFTKPSTSPGMSSASSMPAPAARTPTSSFADDSIPVTPENASRIRQAIGAIRAELRQTQAAQARYSLGIAQLQTRLDAGVA